MPQDVLVLIAQVQSAQNIGLKSPRESLCKLFSAIPQIHLQKPINSAEKAIG